MRALALAIGISTALSLAAFAQQPPAAGGTCSGHKAGCDRSCGSRGPQLAGRCQMNCESIFNTCMQTGEWRGGKRQITDVERR